MVEIASEMEPAARGAYRPGRSLAFPQPTHSGVAGRSFSRHLACGVFSHRTVFREALHGNTGTPTEVVFACVESTLRSLKADRGTWSDATTTRDIDNGLLETSDFNESNIVGIRAQVRYASASGDGRIKIKASGPYFTDLGADQAAKQLATGMARCL
jgi:hypothetical protein